MISNKPTSEQMRSMGYAASAAPVKLSDGAFIAFCAWVNYAPEKMQDFMRYKPAETAAGWERVAKAFENRGESPGPAPLTASKVDLDSPQGAGARRDTEWNEHRRVMAEGQAP